MTDSENELIERAQTGDAEAFSLLASSYERRIYSLALHYTRRREDAEDLSQEVWLKAFSIGPLLSPWWVVPRLPPARS